MLDHTESSRSSSSSSLLGKRSNNEVSTTGDSASVKSAATSGQPQTKVAKQTPTNVFVSDEVSALSPRVEEKLR